LPVTLSWSRPTSHAALAQECLQKDKIDLEVAALEHELSHNFWRWR
jgi:hypothetical protein